MIKSKPFKCNCPDKRIPNGEYFPITWAPMSGQQITNQLKDYIKAVMKLLSLKHDLAN